MDIQLFQDKSSNRPVLIVTDNKVSLIYGRPTENPSQITVKEDLIPIETSTECHTDAYEITRDVKDFVEGFNATFGTNMRDDASENNVAFQISGHTFTATLVYSSDGVAFLLISGHVPFGFCYEFSDLLDGLTDLLPTF